MVTSHTDLAPTFLALANSTRPGLDGKAIPTTVAATKAYYKKEHVAIEYWGLAVPEGIYGYASDKTGEVGNSYSNNTYKGIRLISDDYSLYYAVWCTNEVEYYNLMVRSSLSSSSQRTTFSFITVQDDPHQTVNLAAHPAKHKNYKIANRELPQILHRLDALMMVLKSCEGDACRYPWRQLHPAGKVETLAEALDSRFDKFYKNQPKVSFSKCEIGYHISSEGAQKFHVYGGGEKTRRGWGWDDLFWW